RDAPLDDPRLDGAWDRDSAWREVGLRGGGLGRLLRLGPGRERGADAVACRDRIPPLGDGAGEEEHAPGLERDARHRSVLPLDLRHLSDTERADQLAHLLRAAPDRPLVLRLR